MAMVQVPQLSLLSQIFLSVVVLLWFCLGFVWIRVVKLIRFVDEWGRWSQLAHGFAVDL